MKKFKSLMLAALASATLAAPSFAGGHGSNLVMTGEIVVGMEYNSETPDGGDTTTVQRTYIGDVNAKLTSAVSDTASYAFEFLKDDEGAGKVSFEATGTATSGDNSIKAFADLSDITGTMGYGDVYLQGGNKSITVKVGKFGLSENYANGLGYFRASSLGIGNIEHILIEDTNNGFRGLQINVGAGDIEVEAAVPWMSVKATSCTKDEDYCVKEDVVGGGGGYKDTNVTGIRPTIKAKLGAANISATLYALSFSAQTSDTDTVDKSDNAFQLMGSVGTGAATVGLGYTSRTRTNGDVDSTPSTLNGYVKVGLGGGQNVGASFDILGDGEENDEAKATRISASYDTPFFVEAITLKLGVGTSTINSDKRTAGSGSGLEAEWVYNF